MLIYLYFVHSSSPKFSHSNFGNQSFLFFNWSKVFEKLSAAGQDVDCVLSGWCVLQLLLLLDQLWCYSAGSNLMLFWKDIKVLDNHFNESFSFRPIIGLYLFQALVSMGKNGNPKYNNVHSKEHLHLCQLPNFPHFLGTFPQPDLLSCAFQRRNVDGGHLSLSHPQQFHFCYIASSETPI